MKKKNDILKSVTKNGVKHAKQKENTFDASKVQPLVPINRSVYGRWNYFEVGGGGGQTSHGVQGNPYLNLKTPRIWPTIFWQGPKFTCKNKKMNDIDSQSWGTLPNLPSGRVKLPPVPASPVVYPQ